MEPRRRPSMADVGRVAGVSAQTVSRHYTGGYVSARSRERIEAAVRELGYNRSRLPQILRAARTGTLGFLATGPMNHGGAAILAGMSRAARAAGQTLLISLFDVEPTRPADHEEVRAALDGFLSVRVDGIVLATPYVGLEDLLGPVARQVPVVVLTEGEAEDVSTVHADSYGAARAAVRHLLGLGHRRIVHLAGPGDRNEAAHRLRGYLDELGEWGCEPLGPVRCAEWDADSGAAAAARLDPRRFTAVFAANDEIALGFTSAMRERGVLAPDDYSIVGVDDMPEARYFTPPLTSARLDFERVGELGLRVLLDRVEGTAGRGVHVVPSTLSVRDSTRALTGR